MNHHAFFCTTWITIIISSGEYISNAAPKIETNETKNDPRVPYDHATCMVWNAMKKNHVKIESISQNVLHIGNMSIALQRWTQTTEGWFSFSNQQPNCYSKWDETKQFQDPIAGIAPFQTSWVQNIDHEIT